MTRKQIKAAFREKKIQLGAGAIEAIEEHVRREVRTMARRCGDGNLKRLTPELMWVALGNWS